jgi:hypothetical protein
MTSTEDAAEYDEEREPGGEDGTEYFYSAVAVNRDGREGAFCCPQTPPGSDSGELSRHGDREVDSLADCFHMTMATPNGSQEEATAKISGAWRGSIAVTDSSGVTHARPFSISVQENNSMVKGSWEFTNAGPMPIGNVIGQIDESSLTFLLVLQYGDGTTCGSARGTYAASSMSIFLSGSCGGDARHFMGTFVK